MSKVYWCREDFDSFLTAVFHCYKESDEVEGIFIGDNVQLILGGELVEIKYEKDKSERVRSAIKRDGGIAGYERVRLAFESSDKFKGVILLKFLRLLFEYKKSAFSRLADPVVQNFEDMARRVSFETHRMKGIVHFSETSSGIYYAQITPDNNVTEFVMPHFAERFAEMDFIIHDVLRNIVGICSNGKYVVKKLENSITLELSKEEMTMRELWKTYFSSVSIDERKNERQQNGYLPKRYRKNMVEFEN